MNRKFKQTIYIFLILSLFIHLSVVLTLVIRRPPAIPVHTKQVEVEFVPASKVARKRLKTAAVTKTDQIVEQKERVNDEIDDKTAYLSAFNQKVLQQTRAEKSGKFNNTAKGGKKDEGQKEEKTVEKEKSTEPDLEQGEMPALKDLAPKFSMDPGPKAPDAKDTGDPSQTDDYLKNVNTGMQTLLSTREFVYYSYYARIKEAIRQHWEPDVREKVKIIYRQGRTIASSKDRVTQVLVTLDAKGDLIRVDVLTQSGVEQLDNAAVEAFRAAAPFPNPPKGMIESDGTIKIRWDFVLEV
jgi:protein TonB